MTRLAALIGTLLLTACNGEPSTEATTDRPSTPAAAAPIAEVLPRLEFDPRRDYHSYAEPETYVTRHLLLDLTVDFAAKTLLGTATLDLERKAGGTLALDTRDLAIEQVETATSEGAWEDAPFSLGERDPLLGARLAIAMPADATRVRIRYRTSPDASGLQWLEAALTADKTQPFLFTQSQTIHARSWIPLQDTPAIRMTYSARIRTPETTLALMSAENEPNPAIDGDYSFEMPQPIPSYLLALAVGDLRFAPLGERTGVYAEPSVIDSAAVEFEDTEAMLETAERLFGAYRWGRYDLLILPPSFPYGGMENPRLTFATPTIIAGDKSLVSLVAHELAHSWSGNLVTNATWRDFWLNEGTTDYFTNRIMEAVYGVERAEMERTLEARELEEALQELPDAQKPLAVDPRDMDPENTPSAIAYNRGALFHYNLEKAFGRAAYDRFLASWFESRAFQSVTTEDFLLFLHGELIEPDGDRFSLAEARQWIYEPQPPSDASWPETEAFAIVDRQREAWLGGVISADEIEAGDWTVDQWRRFLTGLPGDVTREQMAALDRRFALTDTRNKMIARDWFVAAVEHGYEPAYPAIEQHLKTVGRMLLIRPIYEALAKTPDGRAFAARVYAEARPNYHPIARASVDRALAEAGEGDAATP
jgi:leukotriene-A4 hydrolase